MFILGGELAKKILGDKSMELFDLGMRMGQAKRYYEIEAARTGKPVIDLIRADMDTAKAREAR
jgi:hypothetical protein